MYREVGAPIASNTANNDDNDNSPIILMGERLDKPCFFIHPGFMQNLMLLLYYVVLSKPLSKGFGTVQYCSILAIEYYHDVYSYRNLTLPEHFEKLLLRYIKAIWLNMSYKATYIVKYKSNTSS